MSEFKKSQAVIDASNKTNWSMVVVSFFTIIGCLYLVARAIH